MSYDFNTQDSALEIPNPFKIENAFLLCSALILFAGGVYLTLVARSYMQADRSTLGAVTVALGGLLFAAAVKFGMQALSQFRFYYGRQFPKGLAEQTPNGAPGVGTGAAEVIEVMRQRAIEFPEPTGPLNGVLYSLFRHLITSPPQMQAAAVQHFHSLIGMGAILASLIVSCVLYSGTQHEGVISWLYLPLTGLSLVTPFVKRDLPVMMQASNKMMAAIVALVGVSIIAPVLIEKHLPAFQVPPMWLAPGMLLVCSMVASALLLLSLVAKVDDVKHTDVSCEQTTIAMNCPPSQLWTEIGRDFQNNWVHSIPNRTYANVPPDVSTAERGSFAGHVLEETQPLPFGTLSFATLRDAWSEKYVRYLILLSTWGLLLSVIAAGVAAYFAPRFGDMARMEISRVILAVIAIGMANALAFTAGHLLWSRMYFKSRLIWIECSGTFQTSKLSIGNQWTGKALSSSTLTRVEDATLRVWATDIVSVAFGKDADRRIMALAPADSVAKSMAHRLIGFAASQSSVAVPTSERDLGKVDAINRLDASLQMPRAAHEALAGPSRGVLRAGKRRSGRVKFFNTKNQYGFIIADDGVERFFNANELGGATVSAANKVVFEPADNPRGPIARKVRALPTTEGAAYD